LLGRAALHVLNLSAAASAFYPQSSSRRIIFIFLLV
jgi:hypothetical protein